MPKVKTLRHSWVKKTPNTKRDQHTDSFYLSRRWRRLSKLKRKFDPLCECDRCKEKNRRITAEEVHHIKGIKDRPDLKYEWSNLMSISKRCHSRLNAIETNKKRMNKK